MIISIKLLPNLFFSSKNEMKSSVNKNFLLSKLGEFFKDNEKSQVLTTYIYDNRIKEEKVKLKRVIEKKKINI